MLSVPHVNVPLLSTQLLRFVSKATAHDVAGAAQISPGPPAALISPKCFQSIQRIQIFL